MIRTTIFLALLGLIGTIVSCEQDQQFGDYASYLSEDGRGLEVQYAGEDLMMTARYVPIEYQALKDGASSLADYLGHQYLQLRIQPTEPGVGLREMLTERFPDDHEDKWMEFLMRLQSTFELEYGAATYPCVLSHVVPPAMQGQGADVLLVFKDEVEHRHADFQQPLILQFKDPVWTAKTLRFPFPAQDLNAIPLPKLNLTHYDQ